MKQLLRLVVLILLVGSLGVTSGDCSDVFFSLFYLPCDQSPNISYNELDSFTRFCVTSRGRIYEVGECGNVALVYQAPGEPDLLSLARTFGSGDEVAVGAGGAIVRYSSFSWDTVSSPTRHTLRSACPKGWLLDLANDYFAVGDSGTIIKSTDRGVSWFSLPSPTSDTLYSVECLDNGSVMVFGAHLAGYKSTDGGSNWTQLNFPQYSSFSDGPPDLITSFFLNDSQGYVFGEFGLLFSTTDEGATWGGGFAPGFSEQINTAYFASFDSGMVAGDNGTIRFTTNGGMSWFSDSIASSLTTHNIHHFGVVDSTMAVIVGDSGTVVFVSTDSTALSVDRRSGPIPTEFQLLQNYPNPFNPSTTISFEIPVSANVRLRVFDVAGRELAELVNERSTPGSYGFRFDGKGLASGVYFYRLELVDAQGGSNSVLTRKMILLR